jgi:polysaccharide export outer membrane protein
MATLMTKRNALAMIGAALLWAGAPSAFAARDDQSTMPTRAADIAFAPAVTQQTSAQPVAPAPTIAADSHTVSPDARYQLRRGDVLELNFPFVPDFNQTITVQPDGFVTLRVVGALRADGLTVPELIRNIRAEYASILVDPVITVELKDFERPYFIVGGEVARPGKYDLRGETTATQAIAVAGGLKDRAKHSEAAIFRRLPGGGFETKTLNLKKMLKEAQLGADPRLESGDMLFIPKGWRIDVSEVMSSLWVLSWMF